MGGPWINKKTFVPYLYNRVDILCIAEPWVHATEVASHLQHAGFFLIPSLRSVNYSARPHGGLLLYIRDCFRVQMHSVQDNMGKPDDIIWMRLLDITWGFIYLPPSTSTFLKEAQVNIIDHLHGELSKFPPPYFLLGDFNAHIYTPMNAREQKLLTLMSHFALVCLNDAIATYVHAGASTIIDLCLVSSSLSSSVSFATQERHPISLHSAILSHVSVPSPTLSATSAPSQKLPYDKPPVNAESSNIDNHMNTLLKKAPAARRTEQISMDQISDCPNMTSLRKRFRIISSKPLTSELVLELTMLREAYKKLANSKERDKRSEQARQLWDIRGRKGYWDHIKRVMHGCIQKLPLEIAANRVYGHFKNLLEVDTTGLGRSHSLDYKPDPYFARMGLPALDPPQRYVAPPEDLDGFPDVLADIPDQYLLSMDITPLEISFARTQLQDSAKGEDNISVKQLSGIPAKDIAEFFSTMIEEQAAPTYWSRSILVPLPKVPRPTAPTELRGISIQPTLKRLFSACICRRLYKFCEIHCLLPPSQSGFRPGHRTTSNIFILRCLIERSMAERKPLFAASVDIAKAFDKVNRALLWRKLKSWGICGDLIDMVKVLYADPTVTVKLDLKFSDFIRSTSGVLQGDPLSPLLFILYIADAPITSWTDPTLNGIRISGLLLADDLMLLPSSVFGIENKLALLHRYLGNHYLQLNLSKS